MGRGSKIGMGRGKGSAMGKGKGAGNPEIKELQKVISEQSRRIEELEGREKNLQKEKMEFEKRRIHLEKRTDEAEKKAEALQQRIWVLDSRRRCKVLGEKELRTLLEKLDGSAKTAQAANVELQQQLQKASEKNSELEVQVQELELRLSKAAANMWQFGGLKVVRLQRQLQKASEKNSELEVQVQELELRLSKAAAQQKEAILVALEDAELLRASQRSKEYIRSGGSIADWRAADWKGVDKVQRRRRASNPPRVDAAIQQLEAHEEEMCGFHEWLKEGLPPQSPLGKIRLRIELSEGLVEVRDLVGRWHLDYGAVTRKEAV